jgi:CheY-like chemotaxis protein
LIMRNQQRSQRLEAIGQLSGGIAHDFNNLLAIIQGNLELISEQIDPANRLQKQLTAAINSAQRGAKVTSKLLSFAVKNSSGSEIIDPTDIISHMKELIAKSMTTAIHMETKLQDNLWHVDVDSSDLEDAIINLCLNARDAMPNGGKLTITTENAVVSEHYARLYPSLTAGDYVTIKVSDDGVGLGEELKDHIFEPFFTTKSKGQGTGLGLSMVFGFVNRSGGHITVDSTVGNGSEFTLYLPRSRAEKPPEPSKENRLASLTHGTEAILVVDDEEGLVELAQQTLESLGYKVYSTTKAEAALALLAEHPDIDLLFSDIVMPGGMNGFQLAAAALSINPNLKVQLTSGFARAEDLVTANSDPRMKQLKSRILSKPYRIAELANSIRTALDKD